ncbi:MAG: septum site-determining protein MinC [Anaerolineales bacterium]|jgi:septum site-determining protein MinC|nr:septum site-determining protein MinC [Anaerolineales bacterium]
MNPEIKIKGIRDGLLIMVGDGEWADLQTGLLEQLQQRAGFIQGARITLDIGTHILHAAEMGKLRDTLSEMGVTLHTILSQSPITETTAQSLGLGTRLSKPHPDRVARPLDTSVREGEPGILVQRTLRSGYKLEYPGHVTIVGDVNPGAEVVASGSIIVWGRLRGVVHAGAEGDEQAFVCALVFAPTQLRIAGQITIPPQAAGRSQPEIVSLRDGQAVAEPWDVKR